MIAAPAATPPAAPTAWADSGTAASVIEVGHRVQSKEGQYVSGDIILTRKLQPEGRVLAVLSDGLGSGVKASVLATLTATLAIGHAAHGTDARATAQTLMDTLPVCSFRKISYSTFTIVDLDPRGRARVLEHGNPPLAWLRGADEMPIERSAFTPQKREDREVCLSAFPLALGDRLLFFSDGVSQSGMGRAELPLGWGRERALARARAALAADPTLSADDLAQLLVTAALENDGRRAKDDVSCCVVCYRKPRRLLVLTGPPWQRERDADLAARVLGFGGRIAVCGGTTATILARGLGRTVEPDLTQFDPELPPLSRLTGVDLVTEGTLTLARTAELLEQGARPEPARPNGAHRLLDLMLRSDMIEFLVGTWINEAHQDPNLPAELGLRRHIIRRIAEELERKHLKATRVELI